MLPREWLSHHKVPRRLTLEQWIADLALRLRRLEALSASCAARDEGLENAAALRVWIGAFTPPFYQLQPSVCPKRHPRSHYVFASARVSDNPTV